MLLFSDGFEYFHPNVDADTKEVNHSDLLWKWDSLNALWVGRWFNEWRPDYFSANIVFGEDTAVNPSKPFARKGGRALHFSPPDYIGKYRLTKDIRKSRTVFILSLIHI